MSKENFMMWLQKCSLDDEEMKKILNKTQFNSEGMI